MNIDRTMLRWNGYGWAAHKDDLAARDEVWSWLAARLGMPALLATPARSLKDITVSAPTLSDPEMKKLTDIAGAERVRTDTYERVFHARARTYAGLLSLRSGDVKTAPAAIVYPRASEEIVAILGFASENGIAVVPRGGGTAGAECDGTRIIVLDMSGMDRVLEIENDVASFEAGISGPALEKALQAKNRTLGHHTETFEFSTLGGGIAQGDAGFAALRYGAPSDWVISLKLATSHGLWTVDEPYLCNIVAGSRGGIGIITEATVRTRSSPEARETRRFLFPDFVSGQNAMRQALEDEIPLVTLSLSDAEETRFWQAFHALGQRQRIGQRIGNLFGASRGFDENTALLSASFEGSDRAVNDAVTRIESLAAALGAKPIKTDRINRSIPLGCFRDALMERGTGIETLTFVTSWSKLEPLRAALRKALQNAFAENAPRPGAQGVILSSVTALPRGKVNLNLTYVFPQMLGSEIEQYASLGAAVCEAAHQQGIDNVLTTKILHAVKRELDPNNTLNPGIF